MFPPYVYFRLGRYSPLALYNRREAVYGLQMPRAAMGDTPELFLRPAICRNTTSGCRKPVVTNRKNL